MTLTCPACRETELPDRSRFCPFCGAELAAPSRPYTPPHLREVLSGESTREGERKEVTVLFADVADSLAMAEALDPEEIHAVMDGFFAHALDAIHAERGTINQFRGDGFMALFGAPRTLGEDAARGLRAALAIRESVEPYDRSIRRRFGFPILLRMGLHTGTVWVGSIGKDLRRDYTAEGPTVGLASRLERAATPGQILLSEETARRARPYVAVRELGLRRFRGVRQPVRVFELVGPGPHRGRFEAQRARGLTPFVGRTQELDWLEREGALQRKGVVEIAGEAGIGKSRLVHEYVLRLASTPVLDARCREPDASRAYAPWLEILRGWPEALPGGEAAVDLARRFGGKAAEVSGTAEAFARELGELLAGAARGEPLLLVLDDAHWLDPSSRHVLDLVSQEARLERLSFILTVRGDAPREPAAPPAAQLELGPLDPEHSAALSRAALGPFEDSEPLVRFAVDRGAGNPLFIEEVARALREGPDEVRRTARSEIEIRQSPFRIPDTLRGVIAARIDALPDAAKRLLLAASVVGVPFDAALLRELDPEWALERSVLLDELVERGLLARERSGSLEFQHLLTREVAYAQLLLSRRRVLHARCADALVERGKATPDGASRIGGHYDLGGQPVRAAEYLATAGRAYLKLHAPDEAAAHLQRAWDLLRGESSSDAAERAAVGLALASALNGLDRARDAGAVLEVVAGEGLGSTDRRRVARACIEGGWVRFSEGSDLEEGRRLIERGIALVEEIPSARRLEMGAHAYLARLHSLDGEVGLAVTSADRVVELARGLDDGFFEMFGVGTRGSALCHRGDLESALAACQKAVMLADDSENDVAIGFAYSFLAELSIYLGQPARALEAASRAREAGERAKQVGAIYHAAMRAGEAYLLQGETERAVAEFERLSRINPRWPSTIRRRARGLLALGRFAEAAEVAEDCLGRRLPRLTRALTLSILGRALGLAQPPQPADGARARWAIAESIRICEELELRPHLAEAESAMSELLARSGAVAEATCHADRAISLYEACGMRHHADAVPRPR